MLVRDLTQTEYRDRGFALSFYDVSGLPLGAPQQEWIHFNNRDLKQPTLEFIPWPIQVSSIIFKDGSEQNTAGGGGGGSQTPWLSDIDADGYSLQNFNQLVGSAAIIGSNSPTQGVFISALGPRGFLSGGTYGAYTELDINGAPLLLNRRDLGNGLVGVGLLNPQYMLDVWRSINIDFIATIGGLGSLSFTNSIIPSTDQRVVMLFAETENTYDSSLLAFYTSNTGVLSERMRLNSQGNLGIGTANPGSRLSIVGLPTSPAGLNSGDVWNNAGVLNIV